MMSRRAQFDYWRQLPAVSLIMMVVCLFAVGLQGCNTYTFSPAVMEQLCCVSETELAAADFEEAARRSLQHKLQQ